MPPGEADAPAARGPSPATLAPVPGARLPRVLFLRGNVEDYLADSLLHGLRTVLGDACVDFPKAETLYDSHPPERRARLYGRGFTLYGLLEDGDIDRNRVLDAARAGDFDLVVFGDVWRDFGTYLALAPELDPDRVAVLDGADSPHLFPYSGRFLARREWRFLPRAHTRHRYFKRELTPGTLRSRLYRGVPERLCARLPVPRRIHPIAFSIPEEHVVAEVPVKRREFGSHVVDPEVRRALPAEPEGYLFTRMEDYYADLRAARFGITTKRAGWDCLRHYEIAANGCVPCFRRLGDKPPRCAPHGLDATNCVIYGDAHDLMAQVRRMDDPAYAERAAAALGWARANTTRRRAHEFLAANGLPVEAPAGG